MAPQADHNPPVRLAESAEDMRGEDVGPGAGDHQDQEILWPAPAAGRHPGQRRPTVEMDVWGALEWDRLVVKRPGMSMELGHHPDLFEHCRYFKKRHIIHPHPLSLALVLLLLLTICNAASLTLPR
jgi:hypothetical protein